MLRLLHAYQRCLRRRLAGIGDEFPRTTREQRQRHTCCSRLKAREKAMKYPSPLQRPPTVSIPPRNQHTQSMFRSGTRPPTKVVPAPSPHPFPFPQARPQHFSCSTATAKIQVIIPWAAHHEKPTRVSPRGARGANESKNRQVLTRAEVMFLEKIIPGRDNRAACHRLLRLSPPTANEGQFLPG